MWARVRQTSHARVIFRYSFVLPVFSICFVAAAHRLRKCWTLSLLADSVRGVALGSAVGSPAGPAS